MFEWNDKDERDKSSRVPTGLTMPQQAPPVNRTGTTPTNPDEAPGVEANGLLRTLFGF